MLSLGLLKCIYILCNDLRDITIFLLEYVPICVTMNSSSVMDFLIIDLFFFHTNTSEWGSSSILRDKKKK